MHPNAGLQMVKMEITEKVLLKKLSLKKDPSYVQTACLELLVLLIGCGLCSGSKSLHGIQKVFETSLNFIFVSSRSSLFFKN